MSNTDREKAQTDWLNNTTNVMCATIAFGMGVDKSDVRFVYHHSMPKSLGAYAQETGRAGRDGKNAVCILYFNYQDFHRSMKLIDNDNVTGVILEKKKKDLREMVVFCDEIVECRHTILENHFSTISSPKNCRTMCDNCQNRGNCYVSDFSEQAKLIYDAVKLCNGGSVTITLNQLVEVLVGANGRSVKEKPILTNFVRKLGKIGWENSYRIVRKLIAEDYLNEIGRLNVVSGNLNVYLEAMKDVDKFEMAYPSKLKRLNEERMSYRYNVGPSQKPKSK